VIIDQRLTDMDGAMLGREIANDATLAGTKIVMLTTMDRPADVQRFTALGFAGSIAKPVRIRELLRCLDRVLAPDSQAWHSRSQPMPAAEISASAQRFSGDVLLVEDNAVNQKVAKRFLERLGCTVTLAGNGAEAIEAFKTQAYDVVFMDLQMPVMDGFTATRHIRDHEAFRKRTPIIALTANAMVGQHERCLAGGMDGFLTKPLDPERLREILARYLGDEAADVAQAREQEGWLGGSVAQLIDLRRFDQVTGGDPAFAQELIEAFAASSTEIETELQAALATNDRKALERSAHKLKGAAANIHAPLLRTHAEELETCASTMDELQLEIHLTQMRLYVERTLGYLRGARPGPTQAESLRSA
jgi:CheY-like chemotaxis protein/HPt (histidine-containing phosphotransfer) domain-containing protein